MRDPAGVARATLTGRYGRQADAGEKRGCVASMLAEGAALFGDEGLQLTLANNLAQWPGPGLRQPEPNQADPLVDLYRPLRQKRQRGRRSAPIHSHCRALTRDERPARCEYRE